MKDKTTILINPRDRSQKEHQFTFDYSFWSHDGYEELENGYLYPIDDRFTDQKKIFKELGEDILKNAWNGFNICLFAYGQTGAGKSYSMLGYESNRGIVPLACEKIFELIETNRIKGKKEFEVTLSMLEIYNEKVQDLFMHTSKRPINGLKIRESKKTGVYVEGISRFEVHSYAEIERRMEEGAKNRSLASTLMNEYSSRAHTIVMIEFIQKEFITEQKINKKSSMLNLVDLAGSERIAKTGISDRDRLKEASQINKSLHTLGRVIEHLAEVSAGKLNVQIPYRESALTRILETALGGNSMTTMICAISPANDNYEETLSTLRYADQTKKIKNKPIINESAVDKIIRELREENERLKQMLRIAKMKGINLEEEDGNIYSNIAEIQREIRKTMQSFAINTDDNGEEDESMTISEFVDLPDPNDSFSNVFDQDSMNTTTTTTAIGNARANAFITNLSEDRLLSFKIKYSCEEELYVGNKNLKEGGKNKLVLCGLGVEDRHARLYEVNNKFYIEPLCEQAYDYTLVNGKSVDRKTEIFHNDRIIFGTNSVFLFKNFNQKGIKANGKCSSGLKVGLGTSTGCGDDEKIESSAFASPSKDKNSIGIGESIISPTRKKEEKNKTNGISIGTDDNDLNESLLLDWDEEYKQSPTSKSATLSTSPVGAIVEEEAEIDEKLLDYEFAINERQFKMLDTSTSRFDSHTQSSINGIQADEMANKLLEIEKEFEALKTENNRVLKEKEEEFIAELRKIEIEREVEKAKLREELKTKELEAKKIFNEKQRIEKIRDMLLQRKEKQRINRESMLLDDYTHSGSQELTEFVEVPFPSQHQTGNYSKKKVVSTHEIEVNTEEKIIPQIETRIEYVDRHHFHYDFNVVHSEGNQILPIEDYKPQDPSVNTTSTNMTNLNFNQDESLLLDEEELKRNQETNAGNESKIKKTSQNFTFESAYNLNELPKPKIESNESLREFRYTDHQEEKEKEHERKQSLNLTDILLDSYTPRKGSRKSDPSEEDENLLNMTSMTYGEVLDSYLPSEEDLENRSAKIKESGDVSLNFSDDLTSHYQIREEELLEKIREYEERLKILEESAKEKKENIKNIRKSFAVDFGENPNSDNFFDEENLFEGEFDFSDVKDRKDSGEKVEETESEKQLRRNIVKCKNLNILNERELQVRKRNREATELKEAFIKKEKKELQKQLVELIPMLEKFNLWAREMNRNLEGKIEIDYHNFTNYEIIDALKSSMKGKIKIMIKILNYEEGRMYKWPVEVFQNRFEIVENLFEKFLENQSSNLFSDKTKDPFWESRESSPFAVAYLSLESLTYALEFEGEIPFVWKGKIVGYLEVILEPTIDRKTMKLRDKINETIQNAEQIYDPRQLLEQDLTFTISFEKFRPTEHLPTQKIEKYYFSYELLEDNYKKETYKTQEVHDKECEMSMAKTKIGYMLKHSLNNVTEHTIAYLSDSPLCITLNLLFEYDEEMTNLTSSFIEQSESSLNISCLSNKLLKSEAENSNESPPPFAKKKQTIILENPDILSKIEERYTNEQTKQRKKIEAITSSKKKDKNKEDCTIF